MTELDAQSSEDDILDEAIEESFPASDPISVTHAVRSAHKQAEHAPMPETQKPVDPEHEKPDGSTP